MKKSALLITLCLFFAGVFYYVSAFATACNGSKESPCIVQDTKIDVPEIKHFRTVQMIVTDYPGNVKGLEGVWISGSGANSREGWKAIAAYIEKATDGKVKKIINLDLREESHGFLNGNSINLTSEYNWINRGKPAQQSFADEQHWLNKLALQSSLDNILTATQFKSGEFLEGKRVEVQTIENEAKLTEKEGFHYIRLPVSDHMAPKAEQVDTFVHLVDALPKDTWMHIHCRGGNGRTTAFMVMYDILKNANQISFDEIIKRHASVPPFYNLYEVERNDPALTPHYKARLAFLRRFYQFAQDRFAGYKGNWSEWKGSYPIKTGE